MKISLIKIATCLADRPTIHRGNDCIKLMKISLIKIATCLADRPTNILFSTGEGSNKHIICFE